MGRELRLEDVGVSYSPKGRPAIWDTSFVVEAGSAFVLIGGSGSGKSTCLKTINRLVVPSRGRVVIGGNDVAAIDTVELRRSVGYVAQDVGLMSHLSVGENAALGLRAAGIPAAEREQRAATALETVGLDPSQYRLRKPRELSGGQKQRVAVARALAGGADILLLDEPFGAVDAITRADLQREIHELRRKSGMTIVLVTHDIGEALLLGTTIGVMNEGCLEQCASPSELIRNPATPFVRELVERARRSAEIYATAEKGR